MKLTRSSLVRGPAAAVFACCAAFLMDGQTASAPEPRWWKGNLHTHTLWSDGDDFPESIASWYRAQGYHFLALSDHNVQSTVERWMLIRGVNDRAKTDAMGRYRAQFGDAWVQTRGRAAEGPAEVRLKTLDEVRSLVEERGRFLMIPSEEITGGAGDGHTLHMNATNLTELLPFQMGAGVRDTLVRNMQAVEESARRTGREVMLHVNHPNYQWGVTAEDLAAVVGEQFFEVWNGVDEDGDPGDAIRASTDEIWDIANTLRIVKYRARPLFALATDDSHHYHGTSTRAAPGRAWTMVRARFLSPDTIVRAYRSGDFYATTGIELSEVAFDAKARLYRLRIAGKPGVQYVTRFIGTRKGASIAGKPRVDAQGEALATTLDYSAPGKPKIGEVLAEVKGLSAEYKLRGDELYVRAVVESTAASAGATKEYPYQRAWTQPAGW
ncbi:MAG: hypothetical protein JNK48_32915 [Bryobacterales bacterium]|nr:hypothetical protein [Bryobacterales bacterium]